MVVISPLVTSEPDYLGGYLSWLGLKNDSRAITTLGLLHSDTPFRVQVENEKTHVDKVQTKKEAAYTDGMVRLAYSRYTNGVFPLELSKKVAGEEHEDEESFLVYNKFQFPMATIKSKLFSPQDDSYFLNQIFAINNKWYREEEQLCEISRWAAHPVYDIYMLKDAKVKAMATAMHFVLKNANRKGIRTVAIFSQRVVGFIRQNNIANIKKMKVDIVTSDIRRNLEENYPLYWKLGNPHVYEVSLYEK